MADLYFYFPWIVPTFHELLGGSESIDPPLLYSPVPLKDDMCNLSLIYVEV